MATSAAGGYMEDGVVGREQSILEATCGDLFDHIDDLLDFPKEDAADVLLLDAPAPTSPACARIIDRGHGTMMGSGSGSGEPLLLPLSQDDAFFNGGSVNGSTCAHISPGFDAKDDHIGSCEELDIAQLEWLSSLFDDTSIPQDPFPNLTTPSIKNSAANAGVMMVPKPNVQVEEDSPFRSSSPISVLEHNSFNVINTSSSSSSSASSSSESFSGSSSGRASSAPISPGPPAQVLVIPARARSKRSRPSAFTTARATTPHGTTTPLATPPPTDTIVVPAPTSSSHSDPESIAESNPYPPPMKKKKKAKKPSSASLTDADAGADYEDGRVQQQGAVRRCMHCQIEKTPQWRAGPMGPKTLCNACGVRYKSGRLFPEYRPAASPTFLPSVHSNSHKKVVEMRLKAAANGDPSDLLQYIRRRD